MDSETYKVVANINEIEKFYNLIIKDNLVMGESILLLTMARKKYLDKDSDKHASYDKIFNYSISKCRPEYSFKDFLKDLYKLEVNRKGFLDKDYNPYPQKCVATYCGLNPNSEYKCILETEKYFNDILNEQIEKRVLKDDNRSISTDDIKDMINKTPSIYNSSHVGQKNADKKIFLDIDWDIDENIDNLQLDEKLYQTAKDFFIKDFIIIRTKGGFHTIVKRTSLCKGSSKGRSNIDDFKDKVKQLAKTKEIEISKNAMIALPGTYQGEFIPYILDF